MSKLIVLRHAKSDWSQEGLTDFDRALNSRGRHDAPKMGEYLKKNGHLAELILCSSSKRTRETHALLKLQAETLFLDELYHASASVLLKTLIQYQSLNQDKFTIMMIAHNPGITEFVNKLCQQNIKNVPTCAAAIIELPHNLSQFGLGTLKEFYKPKDIFY